jgi:hypothetical protein
MTPRAVGIALLVGAAYFYLHSPEQTKAPAPKVPPPAPAPAPKPPPPQPKPRPWGDKDAASVEAIVSGRTHPDGTEIECDLPNQLHLRNKGGSDGAGLCVFTSIAHSARWQNVPLLEDFRDWMTRHPGGGYPSKVDAMIKRVAAERNQPVPDYIQVESNDLEVLKAACRSGRMPGVTYSVSPTGRYGGSRIAHMVSLVSAGVGQGPDGKGWYVILDNNYPGDNAYEWLSEKEFLRAYAGGGTGWAVILLSPPPPPLPRN